MCGQKGRVDSTPRASGGIRFEGKGEGGCRQVICEAVREDPATYTEGFLGKDPEEYCRWISDPSRWGGAIELSILCRSAPFLHGPLPKPLPRNHACAAQPRGRGTCPCGSFPAKPGLCRSSLVEARTHVAGWEQLSVTWGTW